MGRFLKSLFGKDDEAASAVLAGAEVPVGADTEAAPESNAKPVHITDDTFSELVLQSPLPALVDFWAPWCGPCRMLAPIVEDLAKEYEGQAVIAKLNTDENVAMAGELGIMGIPTLILFKDGAEVDRVVGYAPRHALEEKLKAVLN